MGRLRPYIRGQILACPPSTAVSGFLHPSAVQNAVVPPSLGCDEDQIRQTLGSPQVPVTTIKFETTVAWKADTWLQPIWPKAHNQRDWRVGWGEPA